jgi:hypothetical protein
MKYKVLLGLLTFCCCVFTQAQEKDSLATKSNLFTFSPSKLLTKGQWDIKWFNNLYTEVRGADKNGAKSDRMRQNFFTSSLDVFTGINDSKTINVGLSIEYLPIQPMEWMHYLFLNLKTIPHNPADRE